VRESVLNFAGVDEAGRGPLAGPVVAGVVVLRQDQAIDGVRDSKQLSPKKRAVLAPTIRAECVAWAVAVVDRSEIDRINILQASMQAMRLAILELDEVPALLRIDGNRCPDMPADFSGRLEAVVGGDRLCPAIAAASILAKVYRDNLMIELHDKFPLYGFSKHKGYPTAAHRAALEEHGPCPEHRRSFRPVRELLSEVVE
jgi:ribonuclease HII